MEAFDDLLNGIHSATISDVSVLVRQVRLRVGVLSKYVTVRIYCGAERPPQYAFELSDVMRTATPGEAPETSHTAASENEALRLAVRMLTRNYDDAVRRGEMPDDAWLVPVTPRAAGGR